MGKIVTFKEKDLLKIRENMVGSSNTASHNTICVNEARPEVDEFELGQESDNPPVGGNYYHVTENSNGFANREMDKVDYIDYIPHDNPREEGYTAENITEFEPYYELMCYDINDDIIFDGELTLNELFDYFPDKIVHALSNREGRKVSEAEWRIEDILSWNTKPNDIDDVEEVNAIAKRIQPGGPSSYILTDGDIVSFPDHIQITSIEGMTPSKFVGLGNIRIGRTTIELSKEPNREQLTVLRDCFRGEEEIYLDIVKDGGRMYPECICSAVYRHAPIDRVINDIIYYFKDGVRPQGAMTYESKRKYRNLVENKYDDAFNEIINKLMSFKTAKAKEYGDEAWYNKAWMERKHPEVNVNQKDLAMLKDLENKSNEITKLWSLADNEEGANKNNTVKEDSNIIELVTDYFGTTYNLNDAGYILPNGKLLNLHRSNDALDHRNIAGVYQENGIKIWSDEYRYNYVVDFMNHGAIRCDVNAGLLDMVCEPTDAQYSVIKNFVRKAEDVDIDFTNNVGDTQHSVSYSNAKPQRVVSDIYKYFNEGIKPQGDFYESKKRVRKVIIGEDKLASLKENINFEVNSSDIDLSSFRKKNNLAPIWNEEGELNPKIRLKLLDIADDFWEFVNLKWVKPRGIILTGSICNFNWSSFSDIDLHLVVDFDEIDEKIEFVRDYLDAKKNEWNNEHEDLKILDYPIELYVQNLDEMPKSGGIYDLEEDKWLKKPNADDIKSIGLNKFSIKDKAANIMTIIDDMYDALNSTTDSHEIEEIGDDAKYLWQKIKKMRKKSLELNGENGSGNIVYKILRREAYLNKLWKLSTLVYDRINSINESKTEKKKYTVYINGKKDKDFSEMNWKRKPKVRYFNGTTFNLVGNVTESKEVIKEYLEKNYNLPLYKYFKWADTASDEEKLIDIIYHCGHETKEYISKMAKQIEEFEDLRLALIKDEELIYDDIFIKDVTQAIVSNKLTDAFIYYLTITTRGYDLPSWVFMHFERVVKNEWCIHFGADSDSIAIEGFTGGTEDIDGLAYTGAGQEKHGVGYDFAFLLDDRNVDYNNYGDEAVIFQTSGVEIYHDGDSQNQVVFWGPYAKNFIPIKLDKESGEWVVEGGTSGRILFSASRPSEIAYWAIDNLPQYRKQIMAGKNGFIPKYYSHKDRKLVPYPFYRNESKEDGKLYKRLEESTINYIKILKEEVVADGSAHHNPYAKRWKAERKALKDFICNFGKIMTSKENGKQYKCYYDKILSQLIGYNYCICLQWDPVAMKPSSTLYIRALDKFTNKTFQAQYDNEQQIDRTNNANTQQTQFQYQ